MWHASKGFFRNVLNSCLDFFTRQLHSNGQKTTQKLFHLKSFRQNCKSSYLLKNFLTGNECVWESNGSVPTRHRGVFIHFSESPSLSPTRLYLFSLLFEYSPHDQMSTISTSTRTQDCFVLTYVTYMYMTYIHSLYIRTSKYVWMTQYVSMCVCAYVCPCCVCVTLWHSVLCAYVHAFT